MEFEYKKPTWTIAPCKPKFHFFSWFGRKGPYCFFLYTREGKKVCKLVFSAPPNKNFLKLIAVAPDLRDATEKFHDCFLRLYAENAVTITSLRTLLRHSGDSYYPNHNKKA